MRALQRQGQLQVHRIKAWDADYADEAETARITNGNRKSVG
jgi:hypothetical protein